MTADADDVDSELRREAVRRREWITEWFGGRCEDVDECCPVCRQWHMQDEWEAESCVDLTGPQT